MKFILRFNRFSGFCYSTQSGRKSSSRLFSKMNNRQANGSPTNHPCYNITKSKEDNRSYRGLKLANNLRVLLISDPLTEKSAAALDVNVGFLGDPEEIPGIAHFLEHMLFLGTEKYPLENEYSKYLSQHGGCSNAFTSADHTKYFFDVLPEFLPGALDRFSQFFVSPLFTESATSRELKAVDSEHEKNIASDAWRMNQLERSLAKKGHPYRKFGTGNKKTLEEIPAAKGIDVRKILLDFHDSWYSANIMSLAVLGRESLDELEEIVAPLFSQICDKSVTAPIWLDHPVGPEQMNVQTSIVPIEDTRSLYLTFPIPDYRDHYKAAPCQYLSHLVGHEGPGSLLSALKERGWCNNLYGGERCGAKGFSTFIVVVDLTIEGLDHVNDIVTLFFQYTNMLRDLGPQKWIFDECRQMRNVTFQFKDKESPLKYVTDNTSNLHFYPLEEVLVGPFLMSEWKPELIEEILELLVPSRLNIGIVSRSFESDANLTEEWYGTKYKMESIDKAVIKDWENCGMSSELKCPDVNVFIPTNFEILPQEEKATKHPSIIYNSDFARLWFKQDDVFLLPKLFVKFEIASPVASLDPLSRSLLHMFVTLLKDGLNEYAYNATLAELNWECLGTKYGLRLTVGGYNDKLKVLFDKIVDKMTNFTIDSKRFEILKEEHIRDLRNFETKPPYKQAAYYLTDLLLEQSWTVHELLACADKITVKALTEFIPFLLSRVYIEGLIHGNISKEGALDIMASLENKLANNGPIQPLLPQQLLLLREVQLRDGSHFLYETRNKVHKSSSAETYFQCGSQSTQANMELELLAQLISEPCFNILRTEEQLGYMVWSGLRRSGGVQGLRFLIQSDKHPMYLLERIEAFLVYVRDLIVNLPMETFEFHRESHAQLILEKPKKLIKQTNIYWGEIVSKQYHFDRAEVEAAYLRTLAKEHILAFFDKYIGPGASNRHRLSVFVISDADGGAGTLPKDHKEVARPGSQQAPPLEPLTLIEDVTSFKSTQGLYPLLPPYINFNQTKSKL